DLNSNTLTFRSDGIFSSSGEKVLFTRDGRGRTTAITDPARNQIKYSYDAKGDLRSVEDQEHLTTQFTYRTDRPHYLDTVIDPQGKQAARTEYDENGRIKSTT